MVKQAKRVVGFLVALIVALYCNCSVFAANETIPINSINIFFDDPIVGEPLDETIETPNHCGYYFTDVSWYSTHYYAFVRDNIARDDEYILSAYIHCEDGYSYTMRGWDNVYINGQRVPLMQSFTSTDRGMKLQVRVTAKERVNEINLSTVKPVPGSTRWATTVTKTDSALNYDLPDDGYGLWQKWDSSTNSATDITEFEACETYRLITELEAAPGWGFSNRTIVYVNGELGEIYKYNGKYYAFFYYTVNPWIETIEITMEEPVVGQAIDYSTNIALDVPTNANYTASRGFWNDLNSVGLYDYDRAFSATGSYCTSIAASANDGYAFSPDARCYINGVEYSLAYNNGNRTYMYDYYPVFSNQIQEDNNSSDSVNPPASSGNDTEPVGNPTTPAVPTPPSSQVVPAIPTTPASPNVSVSYTTHVQNIGWQDYVRNGAIAGTSGLSLRLEAMAINVESNLDLGVRYRTHVQNVGWQDWVYNGALSGTEGQSLRLEAMQVELTGSAASDYDIYYRVHVQNIGWMGWVKNGELAGTEGQSLRLEGMEIKILPKNNATTNLVAYNTHVENIGWQSTVDDGVMSGTVAQSLRLEGIHITVNSSLGIGVEYRTHIQNIGWESTWASNGAMSGTEGQSLRLEGIEIRLTGENASHYDIYYRTHIQNIGWTGWARNGASCGSAGYSYRLEGIEILVVPAGSPPPGSTMNSFYSA